jgi:hypothetical protein
MKSNLYLNPNTYDIELDNNFNLKVTNSYSQWLSQKIENTLKTLYGEWFANQTLGIPYFQTILKKQSNINQVNIIFKNAIKNIEGVRTIIKFEPEYNSSTRTYVISSLVVQSEENEVIDIGSIIL